VKIAWAICKRAECRHLRRLEDPVGKYEGHPGSRDWWHKVLRKHRGAGCEPIYCGVNGLMSDARIVVSDEMPAGCPFKTEMVVAEDRR
jgi:hypothetical protein